MRAIKELLTGMFIILIPFQDTGLQNLPIGILGASPSFIPLSLLIVVHFFEWLQTDKKLNVNKYFIFIITYVILISIIYIFISGTESHGRNLIIKTVNLSVLTYLFLFPVFYIRYSEVKFLKVYIQISFFILLMGVLITDVIGISSISEPGIFHDEINKNMRPRGFSGESSYLSVMAVTMGILAAHLTSKKILKVIYVLAALLITIYSASKGGMLTIFLTVSLLLIFKTKIKLWLKIGAVLITVAGYILIYNQLQAQFIDDIENTYSTATRTVLFVTSLIVFMNNPFGVGFSGFLPAVDKYGSDAVNLIDEIFNLSLKFEEILSYIGSDTDKAISTKTFLFDYLAYFGLPFLILYIVFHFKLLRNLFQSEKLLLLIVVLFCFIANSTYILALGIYSISIIYGVAFDEIYRPKNSCR